MGHASTYRILLRKAGRIAIMIDSPLHAYDQTRFTIKRRRSAGFRGKSAPLRIQNLNGEGDEY